MISQMKILSLKEPYATLIKEKKKLIETRSWKTNYRGELYIHASKTKSNLSNKSNEFKNMIKNLEQKPGYIICKCKLIDCIYMTDKYIEDIKKNNYQEYICGEYKEGRYAWILDNIEVLEEPIQAKGQLGIWNYYTEFDIMELMRDIKYGWMDEDNQKHIANYTSFPYHYKLQSPKNVLKNKLGVCFDQVELERYYFKGYDIKTYFIIYYDDNNYPNHTFLTFQKNNKYYWFEHSWEIYRGIHEYNTLNELLIDVKKKFIETSLNGDYTLENLAMYEYQKPEYYISMIDFYKHCEEGKEIDLNSLEDKL